MSQLTVLKKMKISEMPVLQNMKKKNNSLFCKIEIYQSITDSCPAKNKQISTHCFAKYKNIRVSQFIVLQNIKHQNYLFSKYKNIRESNYQSIIAHNINKSQLTVLQNKKTSEYHSSLFCKISNI